MTEIHLLSGPYAKQPVAQRGVTHEPDFKYRLFLSALVEPLGATLSYVKKKVRACCMRACYGEVPPLGCGRMQQEKAIMAHAREGRQM